MSAGDLSLRTKRNGIPELDLLVPNDKRKIRYLTAVKIASKLAPLECLLIVKEQF